MLWADQNAVLERVAAGHALSEILNDIVLMIERQAEGMFCSLLLLHQDSATIRHGAAPTLPQEYVRHLDGLPIGPNAGSCGTAAFRRERVIVEDIASHPFWEAYRDLALPFGLRACWSSPIFSSEKEVLGTFAMYYHEPRGPTAVELGWVDAATHVAAIAIVSDRAAKSLRQSEERAKHLARLYAMSSAINEAIVRESEITGLYQSTCRIAVEHSIAGLSWIGLVDSDSQKVVPVAHAGAASEQICPVHLQLAEGESRDPVIEAVRRGFPVICNDIASDPALNWQDLAAAHNLRSYALFPIKHRAAVSGILVIYSEHAGAFGDEEIGVFVTLTEDVAFAVESAQIAAALRRSEERLRTVIEHTPDVAIQWFDESGRIIFYNDASRRLFDWSKDGALGKSLLELGFWTSAEEAKFTEARRMAAAGERVLPTHFSFHTQDGSEGQLLSTVFRIPSSDADHCYVCMDVDLTNYHRMEKAVRAGETLRALIYDCVADVVFYLAVEGEGRYRFQSVNRAFFDATGLKEHDVVGRLVDEVIPETSLTLVKQKYAEAISTRRKVIWEEITRYPTGLKYGDVTVGPIFDSEGRCTHLVGTVHDITDRREAEIERRQIDTQLHQAQRLQALGTLAGGIAHDFNNILAAIHGNIDLTLRALDKEHDARESLHEVKRAAERATSMVRQILMFSREGEPLCEVVDLVPVVQEAVKFVRAAITDRTAIRTVFADDVPAILGESTQIHRVITNLLQNAAHAIGAAQGTIDVYLDRCDISSGERSNAPDLKEGVYARVTVTDSGSGMNEETQLRVFEPFFTTKPVGEGTGMGLSIVHGIVKSHGGAVTVTSEVGKGTSFELLFPAASQKVKKRSLSSDDQPTAQSVTAQRVLFVDDDEAIVVLARRAFSRRGHHIVAHPNSADALLEFRNHPDDFDVVVTDLAMPHLSGLDLVREVRQIRSDIKIVLTSGAILPVDVAMAKEAGVDEIFEKPRSMDDLAMLIGRDSK